MLQLSRLLLGGLAITLLSACGYEHTVIGKIEDDLLITKEEIHEMGYEEFKKAYLGKVITLTDLKPLGWGGGYNLEKGQCKISYSNNAELIDDQWHNPYPISIIIYSNKFPNEVLTNKINSDSYTKQSLEYDSEIDLPVSVCNKCKSWDAETKACFYRSPNTIITGKIAIVGKGKDSSRITMVIRPSGLAY